MSVRMQSHQINTRSHSNTHTFTCISVEGGREAGRGGKQHIICVGEWREPVHAMQDAKSRSKKITTTNLVCLVLECECSMLLYTYISRFAHQPASKWLRLCTFLLRIMSFLFSIASMRCLQYFFGFVFLQFIIQLRVKFFYFSRW